MAIDRQKRIEEFKTRFIECVGDAGSLYSLAKKCDTSIPTLKRYLSGSEPSLTMLVNIAAAAEVNLLWLATGEGAKQLSVRDQSASGKSSASAILERVRTFLRDVYGILGEAGVPETLPAGGAARLAVNLGGIEQAAKTSGIAAERLTSFVEGRQIPDPMEVWKLIETLGISLTWLITGTGPMLQIPPPMRGRVWAIDRTLKLSEAVGSQLTQLSGENYGIHEVRSNSLAPEVQIGDVAFVDIKSRPNEGPGIFLLSGPSTEFLAKVLRVDDWYEISFSDKDIKPIRSTVVETRSSFRIVGRLAYIYRLYRYG